MTDTHSARQANCRLEAQYAYQCKTDMVPLMVEDGYRADGWLGLLLGTRLWYAFYGSTLASDSAFQDKMQELCREVGDRGKITEPVSSVGRNTSTSWRDSVSPVVRELCREMGERGRLTASSLPVLSTRPMSRRTQLPGSAGLASPSDGVKQDYAGMTNVLDAGTIFQREEDSCTPVATSAVNCSSSRREPSPLSHSTTFEPGFAMSVSRAAARTAVTTLLQHTTPPRRRGSPSPTSSADSEQSSSGW
jgi:hypothetical protein